MKADREITDLRIKFSKKTKRKARYFLLVAVIYLLGILPRFIILKIGGTLGSLFSRFDSEAKRKVSNNILDILDLPPAGIRGKAFIKSVFRHLGVNAVEILHLQRKRTDFLLEVVTVRGEQHLEQSYRTGNGVILLTAHLGAWELLGAYIAAQGYETHAIAKTLREKNLNTLLDNSRNKRGIHTHPRGGSFSDLKSILLRGKLLALLMDQDTKVKGIFADFLGKPAYTPTGPAVLACVTKATVIPSYIVFDNQTRKHIITFEPAVEIVRTGNLDHDIRVNTEIFNKVINHWIRAHPEQWVWFHERWKTEPFTSSTPGP